MAQIFTHNLFFSGGFFNGLVKRLRFVDFEYLYANPVQNGSSNTQLVNFISIT